MKYLDYENCLFEECIETAEEVKLAKITCKNENKHKCISCTLCIVLFSILFTSNVGIATYFVYFYWYLKKMSHVLSLVLVLKQQFIKFSFIELINGRTQTN